MSIATPPPPIEPIVADVRPAPLSAAEREARLRKAIAESFEENREVYARLANR